MSAELPTHNLYQQALIEEAALLETLRSLRETEGGRFEWEVTNTAQEVGHGGRYLRKVGEVLYCNWTGCLHADEPEDRHGPAYPTDYAGRAIPIGEGEQWFKGRVHTDCAAAMREQD